jgi:UDP-N-acetylglucosamine transferase subunit ALG13
MIFVAVGTQMHFDRLVEAVDHWAGYANGEEVFAQTGPSCYQARNIKTKSFITPQEFRFYAENARVFISHAGMGSILTALEFGKRVAVMPRRSDLGEHRNDHQLATARYFGDQGRVMVAHDRQELFELLMRWNESDGLEPISATASPVLIGTIKRFIESRSPLLALSKAHE